MGGACLLARASSSVCGAYRISAACKDVSRYEHRPIRLAFLNNQKAPGASPGALACPLFLLRQIGQFLFRGLLGQGFRLWQGRARGKDPKPDQKGGLDNLSCAVPVFSRLSSVPHESEALTTAVFPCDTLWYLATSGTTGTPKLLAHTLTSLSRTVRGDQSEKTDTRWGLFYDYTRFAGLQVVLQALISGATLIAPALDASLTDKLAMLARQGCTHLSATPTMWRTIVMNPGAKDLPLRQITLGGEIADDRILNTLQTIYPTARVTHIYASTEAGVGFSVKDGRGGFPASYLVEPPAGLA
ncbi:MAG: hypothetical protein EOM69_07625, partial [Clostridia bacterium]|nr:hypothetical protein [Clostridia bacterium]